MMGLFTGVFFVFLRLHAVGVFFGISSRTIKDAQVLLVVAIFAAFIFVLGGCRPCRW